MAKLSYLSASETRALLCKYFDKVLCLFETLLDLVISAVWRFTLCSRSREVLGQILVCMGFFFLGTLAFSHSSDITCTAVLNHHLKSYCPFKIKLLETTAQIQILIITKLSIALTATYNDTHCCTCANNHYNTA